MSLKLRDVLMLPSVSKLVKDMQKRLAEAKAPRYAMSRAWATDNELMSKHGAKVWTENRMTIIYAKNGTPSLLGITRDVMELGRADNDRIALPINAPMGMYIVQDRKIRLVRSPQDRIDSSYGEHELTGFNPIRVIHREDRRMVKTNAIRMLKGERVSPYMFRVIDKGGKTRWVMETVAPVMYCGRPAVFGNFMDITQQKCVEDDLRQSREQLMLLSKRVIEVGEEERARIARDLHDELGQEIAALKIEVVSLMERVAQDDELCSRARAVASLTDRLRATCNRIAVSIRPGVLHELGLAKAIQWYGEDFERRSGISCPIETTGRDLAVPEATATAAYRILQECLTNVWKHAKASQVKIKVTETNNLLSIRVSDNGVGMNVQEVDSMSSLGLLGMRERANLVGGTVRIHSTPGKGTHITLKLPLHGSETVSGVGLRFKGAIR